jgi:hypothetical protein
MKKLKIKELSKNVLRYTVKLDNLESGTVVIERNAYLLQVGDYEKNVQFTDAQQNKSGKSGVVREVLKMEFWNGSEFEEFKIK